MAKKYHLGITMVTNTGDGEDKLDGDVLINEYTDDEEVAAIKQQVFKKHLLPALGAATEELITMALAGMKGGPRK